MKLEDLRKHLRAKRTALGPEAQKELDLLLEEQKRAKRGEMLEARREQRRREQCQHGTDGTRCKDPSEVVCDRCGNGICEKHRHGIGNKAVCWVCWTKDAAERIAKGRKASLGTRAEKERKSAIDELTEADGLVTPEQAKRFADLAFNRDAIAIPPEAKMKPPPGAWDNATDLEGDKEHLPPTGRCNTCAKRVSTKCVRCKEHVCDEHGPPSTDEDDPLGHLCNQCRAIESKDWISEPDTRITTKHPK